MQNDQKQKLVKSELVINNFNFKIFNFKNNKILFLKNEVPRAKCIWTTSS